MKQYIQNSMKLVSVNLELIDKGIRDKRFIWNPSNPSSSECDCAKSCDVGQYLDIQTTKSANVEKHFFDRLVEECSENIDRSQNDL